jgi:hypothetical protein
MDFVEAFMFDDIQYVVRFNNGKYFGYGISSNPEIVELKYAQKYSFDWQIIKDHYLQMYISNKELNYEVLKVKAYFEIVE